MRIMLMLIAFFFLQAPDAVQTVAYDAPSNTTAVRLALNFNPAPQFRLNHRFSGRQPKESAGWIGFAFGNNTEQGTHNLSIEIDSARFSFTFPEYSSFQLPRE